MFRLLALTEPSYAVSRKLCRKRRKRGAPVKEVCDIDEEEFYMDLLTGNKIHTHSTTVLQYTLYNVCPVLHEFVILYIIYIRYLYIEDFSEVLF